MLSFTCPACGIVLEYTMQTMRNIQRDTTNIRGIQVCNDCGERYKGINQQVQIFADQKRKELEEAFFNPGKTEEPKKEEPKKSAPKAEVKKEAPKKDPAKELEDIEAELTKLIKE